MQKQIIDSILAKNDTLVLMPTGGGKSLCYQLPALVFPGLTLVVSPLIALMKDQVDALNANGIQAAFLNSSLTPKQQQTVIQNATEGRIKILYLAPERVSTYSFRQALSDLRVNLIAIDEAHCISEWGHDFRPDYRTLKSLKTTGAPIVALTATATPQVEQDIIKQLGILNAKTFKSSFNRANLTYHVRPKIKATAQLIDILKASPEESAIIYCYSRKNTESIAASIQKAGLKAAAYHAGLSKDDRANIQENFIHDKTPIIAATIAFGMGINKPNVRTVIHMDLPKTIEGYYQETGRAGRDGLPSKCILFYTFADKSKQEYFINQIEDQAEKQVATRKLEDILLYCQTIACRRFFLLSYFGEQDPKTSCDACDNCTEDQKDTEDATEITQKILSTILKTGERFGAAHIADVLRGSQKAKIKQLGHNNLSVHGIAKDISKNALRQYIQSLSRHQLIAQTKGDYPTTYVTQKGKQFLINKETISLPIPINIKSTASLRAKRGNLDHQANPNYNPELFESLRALRRKISDQEEVPPYIIFGDKSLHQMASEFPTTSQEFLTISGVGELKQKKYGEAFLNCIKKFQT